MPALYPNQPEWHQRADVQEILAFMLRFPFDDYSVGVAALLGGDFTDAQAMGLVLLSDKIDFKNGSCWKDAPIKNRGRALHIWLWHFMDGRERKLRPPPPTGVQADTQFSNSYRQQALQQAAKWKGLRRKAASPVKYDVQVREVAVLRCKLQQDGHPSSATAGGGGNPAPVGGSTEQQQHTAALQAFAMGTHERLGSGYASRDEPCGVRRLANDQDILAVIADLVRGKPRRQLKPPPREVRLLRASLWHEHKEKHMALELAEERGVLLEIALGDATRAIRREAQALRQAAAIREQFDEYRIELQADSATWRSAVEQGIVLYLPILTVCRMLSILHCSVLYCTVLHCTALYCNALPCTTLQRTQLCSRRSV